MLTQLDWRTLAQRRADARLVMLFKILHGLVAVPAQSYIPQPMYTRSSQRPRPHALPQISTSRGYCKYSFFPITIVQWNSLPPTIPANLTLQSLGKMSQFGAAKNPPWARQDFGQGTAVSLGANITQQQQVVSSMMQPQVPANTVYGLGNAGPSMVQPQYTAQQLAAMGLQAQQQAAAALQQQQNQVLGQPGIAIPTTLASNQVPAVSYPTPRAAQPPQPKQRVFTGTVTKLHDNFGFVDEDVFFQTSCVKGSLPKVSDRVLVEATYNANMPFKWNATRIQVLPNQGNQGNHPGGYNKGGFGQGGQNQGMGNQSGPQPLMQSGLMGQGGMRNQGGGGNQKRNDKFGDRAERKRERDRERRESRQDRPPPTRKRSRTKSPVKKSDNTHQRSPARRRPRIVPRYVVQVPKLSFDMKEANVMSLKSRYTNLYIPSDFFNASFTWTEAFPSYRPFQLGNHCTFHVMNKEVDAITPNDATLDPPDSDHLYSAKVMLLSCPSLEDLYHKSCALAEDPSDVQEGFVHPTRLIHFLVGMKGKNETMAIGGPWSPTLDGANPGDDPKVLIRTAIRTTKALTGIDLSGCTQWYRYAEVRYLRPEETHKGKVIPARVETSVLFLPDVWTCNPTHLEWGTLQAAYKKQLQKKVAALGKDEKEGTSQAEILSDEEDPEGELSLENKEPTHFSELDPKVMKILDLRKELELRSLSSKGLKSQLIARLTKALKTEQEKEEEKEAMETDTPDIKAEDTKKASENEEKTEEKRKEEEEKKKKEEREKASLERKFTIPDSPTILVHPNTTAKGGKFDCSVMSLSVLLDYRPEDNKEHSFEVSLFAELFNEMLMRDFGFEIYKSLVKAPEKKEEEKKEKDKDKKSEEKSKDKDKEASSAKKKKLDEKEKDKKDDKKDKDSKEKEKTKKDKDEDKKDTDKVKEEDDEEEEEGKKEKKREKRKFTTKEPALLLAFTYFDQNHTGYILDKDVEEIIHTIGLQLSRAQVKKLVQKLVSRDALNYRKITDKPVLAPGEKEEPTDVKELKLDDVVQLSNGNAEYLKPAETTNTKKTPSKKKEGAETTGFVTYKGAMIDIESVMLKLEKSEKTRSEMEKQMTDVEQEKDSLQKSVNSKEEKVDRLSSELKQLKQKLLVQEKITNNSESTSKKYLSALMESKTHLSSLLSVVTDALGEDSKEELTVKEEKKEKETNGSV
ncbi:hypothetical protein FSP39_018795 [Pinctada imbricata]|uniref:SAP domain-containing protein n=1 Tax=Pinctada imbricata TaxID=66713 RepID=A0AA88Y8A3_PINIB|nr:hypothetical protein FSP39_018795 [Pinctada imbricata]